MTEFTKDVQLRDVAVRDTNLSDAIDEPFRAMILDMLSDEAMTVSDIHGELVERGFERTENTIRHHVSELRESGLVEVARLEERRGGTSKYYRANTIVLSYTLPEDADGVIETIVDTIEPELADILDRVRSDHRENLDELAADMAPCTHCRTQKYEAYLLLTVLRRAFVRAYLQE